MLFIGLSLSVCCSFIIITKNDSLIIFAVHWRLLQYMQRELLEKSGKFFKNIIWENLWKCT